MAARDDRRLDAIRSDRSELENHYIDELLEGRLSRRQFVRQGAVAGMSAGLVGAILAACGGANKSASSASAPASSGSSSATSGAAPVKGGTLKVAITTPV